MMYSCKAISLFIYILLFKHIAEECLFVSSHLTKGWKGVEETLSLLKKGVKMFTHISRKKYVRLAKARSDFSMLSIAP